MPDTDVAEKVGAETTPETPTDPLVAQPGATDASRVKVEVSEPAAPDATAPAPAKSAREEQLERLLRVSAGEQKKLRQELTALRVQGDPVARTRAIAADVRAARAEARSLGEDPDAAEKAVRDDHKRADADAASAASADDSKAWMDGVRAEMGAALAEAGLSVEDWNDPKNKELRAIRLQWVTTLGIRDAALASQLAEEVKAMKKAPSAPVQKTAAQRARELSLADTGPGGAGAEGDYKRRVMDFTKPMPSAAEIDRQTARYLRG